MATKIFMPRLGESVEEAVIGRWLKEVGDTVARGDVIAELETAKAMMELESPVKGVLLAVFPDVGDAIQMGDLVAIVGKAGENWKEEIQKIPEEKKEPPQVTNKEKKSNLKSPKDAASGERIRIAPNAKRIAKEKGIEIRELAAAFPDKRITSSDIEKFMKESGGGVPTRKAALTNVQRITASRMAESARVIPQFSVSSDFKAKKVFKKLKKSKEKGKKISLTAAIVFHTASAIKKYPAINGYFENGSVFIYEEINIGVAVATEKGLYVPVIRNADELKLKEIADQLAVLREKSVKDALSVDDLSGGTFTISNLGMMGIRSFSALVNPSQAAILAVGSVREEITLDKKGEPKSRKMINLTLSADHRVVGGYECAEFFEVLREEME